MGAGPGRAPSFLALFLRQQCLQVCKARADLPRQGADVLLILSNLSRQDIDILAQRGCALARFSKPSFKLLILLSKLRNASLKSLGSVAPSHP